MSPATNASVFNALGDATRLVLIEKLSEGEARAISSLAKGLSMSRQAVTKHLRVLESAGIVHADRLGRESLYRLDPRPLQGADEYLAKVSEHWDGALHRRKNYLEER